MKKLIGLVLGMLIIPSVASAEWSLGPEFSLGAPDGAGVGLMANPGLPWLKVGASFQDNYLSPGARASVSLTPVKFPVYPELRFDGGFFARENIPFAINGNKSLNVQYDYLNLQLGLCFGNRNGVSFALYGGMSYLAVNVGNIQSALNVSGVSLGNPSFDGFVPSAKMALTVLF